MCGICGIIRFDDKRVHENDLNLMMHEMKFRGPDDEGTFVEKNVGLGFVRLSIIDLSHAGHQPMESVDGRYILIYNGEIFNYIELREELIELGYSFKTNTDTEVLLNSYIHWGEMCMNHFNGMWAFVVYDKLKNEIFGCRDRYGIKPLYYLNVDNQFLFASDISAILKVVPNKLKANEEVIYNYLVFNRTDQDENTFFSKIKKLQHGSFFHLYASNNHISIQKWYDLRSNLKEPFTSPDELRDLFSSSIGLRLRSDVPVGVCLSGGLDSSSIVSTLLKDFNKKDLNTFSALYGKGVQFDESDFINEYRESLSNMYFITPTADSLINDLPAFVKAHSEPVPTTSPYAQFKVMELAKKHVVVTLDGQGADEQLAGYDYFFGFYFKDLITNFKLLKFVSEAGSYLRTQKSLMGFSSLFFFLLSSKVQSRARILANGSLHHYFADKNKDKSLITSNLYSSGSLHEALLDHFEYKLEHLLKWEDKNSMWFSLEARVPFLDHRLVERILSLPPEKIIKDGYTKFFFREAMSGTLPEKIRLRKDKVGFDTPQNDWFREDCFVKLINSIISSDSFYSRKIIDPVKAKALFERHLARKINISREIWKWIHLELWFREFID
jgi:asparagine synthase (glutamine-hydrolysing)